MLTKKQRDLLVFIHERVSAEGVAPSFDEMKDALDLKSKSGVHRLITGLVERGYLERLPNRARALDVKKLPEDILKKEKVSHASGLFHMESGAVRHIPLYGKIAAGTPIEAIRHEGDYIDAPLSMLGNGEFYALTVDGESMKEAGINDGDLAIIRRTEQARNGDIVVAMVDSSEVTLKILEKKGPQIHLVPQNSDFETQIYNADQVEIQGVLASIIRRY